MPDVEFKTKKYNKEMRRMKKTIAICVAVFVILVCFSAYVIRIKDTSDDFGVVQFNQGVFKGKPSDHQPALNVLEPGRFGGYKKGPKIQTDNKGRDHVGGRGHGRGGGLDRGHVHRLPQTAPTSHESGQGMSSFSPVKQQSLKDKIQNTKFDDNKGNNKVQSDKSQSSSFSNLSSKLKEFAKQSGENVNGLLEKLWNLTKRVSSSSNNQQYGESKQHHRNWFQDAEGGYWYDRSGVKHRDYSDPNFGGSRDGHQDRYRQNNRIQDNNRVHGGYWNDDDSRDRMGQTGYNKNRGSNRNGMLSNRRYGNMRNHYQPYGESGRNIGSSGDVNGRIYDNRKPQDYGKDNQRFEDANVQDNFPVKGAQNRGQINSEDIRRFDNDYRTGKTGPDRDRIQSHNVKNSALNARQRGRSRTYNNNYYMGENDEKKLDGSNTRERLYDISHLGDDVKAQKLRNKANVDTIHTTSLDEETKGIKDQLYNTRNLIKKRIKYLIQLQRSAKPGDKSLYLSISLLQSVLGNIESELHVKKDTNNKTAVNDLARDTNKTSLSQSVEGQIKHDSRNITTTINSNEKDDVDDEDDDSTSTTQLTNSSADDVHEIKHVFRGNPQTGKHDININNIHLEDWKINNTRITNMLRQLTSDPTKVDIEDITKDFPGTFDCVRLQTVTPNPIICINNPNLDIPLSRSLKNTGLWESHEVNMFQTVLRSNASFNVIDLGSTLGVYTITAAAIGRTVVAVEPLLLNIAPFHRSVRFNKFHPQQIKLVKNPITEYHGVAEMIYRPYGNLADARTSHLSLLKLQYFKGNVHDLVRTITLDDLAAVIPFKSAVMKIDIQGDEYGAFKVASKFFDNIDIRYIFMHWIPTENQTGSKEIADFLTQRNYKAKTALNSNYLDDSELTKDHDVIIWIKK